MGQTTASCSQATNNLTRTAARLLTCLLLGWGKPVPAQQYMYDPAAADEQQQGIKYFGAAKDANGSLLKDVTFQLITTQKTFVFVSDAQGRFRGNLPLDMVPARVTAKCFKPGFQVTRIDVREGPKAPKPTVQVDCYLHASPNPESLRERADLGLQRRYAWRVVESLTRASNDHAKPVFESWHGDSEVFAVPGREPTFRLGVEGFAREESGHSSAPTQPADSPVFTYTLYNDAAFNHIRKNQLYSAHELQRLQMSGPASDMVPGNREVPDFPTTAVVLKTAWWLVSGQGTTALPVWDPDTNPPRPGGRSYLEWHRVVAVDPPGIAHAHDSRVEFAGRTVERAQRIPISRFYNVEIDAPLAAHLLRDRDMRKQAAIVLGRDVAPGDYLILVGMNVATRATRSWVWATLWWHDHPNKGAFADARPQTLSAVWRNYLMQVALDGVEPKSSDGTPHVCFNPWLEGRFPDGGQGGGTVSNCLTCHARASYPPTSFLPVTRGAPQLTTDVAYRPGRLRTSFLWSLALHAAP